MGGGSDTPPATTQTTTYTVTFDANGGAWADESTTKAVTTGTDGKIATLPDDPTRADYTFDGWNTKADGTGDAVTTSTVFTAASDVYAKWTTGGSGDNDDEPRIPDNAAAFKFDDGTFVIQLSYIPTWGSAGTAYAYDPSIGWENANSRYALDGSSTHTISGSMSSKSLMIGFLQGEDGKNTDEITCSDFTVGKINIVTSKNEAGNDVKWTSTWSLDYTLTTEDY